MIVLCLWGWSLTFDLRLLRVAKNLHFLGFVILCFFNFFFIVQSPHSAIVKNVPSFVESVGFIE